MKRQRHRIVVEGMDGSGKSTLIDQLVLDFPQLEIVRNADGPNRDFNAWWPAELDRAPSDRVPIHDRFFWSELVYGPVLRGQLAVGDNLLQNVTWFLRQYALLIYARPHSNILRQSFQVNQQMEGVEEKWQQLLELYDNLMSVEYQWMTDRFIRYDWANMDSYPEVRQRVTDYLNG